jgi:hypothetical protein
MFATKEEVAELRKRAEEWKAINYAGADPMIPQVMDMVLKFSGIAPVWSCEGHFKDASVGRIYHSNFYMMFAVEESAWPVMREIYERLQARLMVHQRRADTVRAQVESASKKAQRDGDFTPPPNPVPRYSAINYLTMAFTNREWPINPKEGGHSHWFNALILNGQTHRKASKSVFFRELISTLVEVNAEARS